MASIAYDAEEIDDLSVKVVIHLGVTSPLLEKDTGSTSIGFGVNLVLWKKGQDPRSQEPFATVVAEDGTGWR
jgi:hypothetical protein